MSKCAISEHQKYENHTLYFIWATQNHVNLAIKRTRQEVEAWRCWVECVSILKLWHQHQSIMNIVQDIMGHKEQLKDFLNYDGVKEDEHNDDDKEEES